MALRRTADRVDDQMVDYLKQNAIEGPWQTAERLLVCIGPDTLSEKVVRTAARLASGLNAPWLVVSIERADRPPPRSRGTQRTGGDVQAGRKPGRRDPPRHRARLCRRDPQDGAARACDADRHRRPPPGLSRELCAQIAAGRADRARFGPRHSCRDRRRVDAAETPRAAPFEMVPHRAAQMGDRPRRSWRSRWQAIWDRIDRASSRSAECLAALSCSPCWSRAVYGGYRAALLAAVLSALAYNFFFIPPVSTFTIASPHEVFGLLIFVIAALICRRAGLAAERTGGDRERAAPPRPSRSTISPASFPARPKPTTSSGRPCHAVQASLRRDVVFFAGNGGELALAAAWPPDTELDVTDMTAARWAFEKKEPAGNGTGTLPNSPFQFRPLGASAWRRQPSSAISRPARPRCRRGAGAGLHARPDGDRHRPRAALEGKPGPGGQARRRTVPLGAALIDLA